MNSSIYRFSYKGGRSKLIRESQDVIDGPMVDLDPLSRNYRHYCVWALRNSILSEFETNLDGGAYVRGCN